MAKTREEQRCVILGRARPSIKWSTECLICQCPSLEKAWLSAHSTQEQQRVILGEQHYEAIVVLIDDYDAGQYNRRRPPAALAATFPKAVKSAYVAPPPQVKSAPPAVPRQAPVAVRVPHKPKPKPKPKPEPEPEVELVDDVVLERVESAQEPDEPDAFEEAQRAIENMPDI